MLQGLSNLFKHQDGSNYHSNQLNGLSIVRRMLTFGFFGILLYSLVDPHSLFKTLGISLGIAVGALLCGALFGFLFGIPKASQSNPSGNNELANSTNTNSPLYHPNTNLEQISDWLTKILVGVTLTQLNSIPSKFESLAKYIGQGFGTGQSNVIYSGSIVIFFCIGGFLYGYLWTRLYLAVQLRDADENSMIEIAHTTVQNELNKQTDIDANAMSVTQKYVEGDNSISIDSLNSAILAASYLAKVSIVNLARQYRKDNWKKENNSAEMNRCINIFKALINADKEKKYFQNYAQLGYALKDIKPPRKDQYAEAIDALTNAIDIRGDGPGLLEYNRAVARILNDENFNQSEKSDEETTKKIVADIGAVTKTAKYANLLNDPTDPVSKWRKLNELQ